MEILSINKRSLKTDPQYFGGYLNQARHNAFIIFQHLEASNAFPKKLENDEDVSKKDKNFILAEWDNNSMNIIKSLERYFPLIRIFSNNISDLNVVESIDLLGFKETLTDLLKDLEEFRNDYSHYFSSNFVGVTSEELYPRKLTVSAKTEHFMSNALNKAILLTIKRFQNVFNESDFNLIDKRELISNGQITEYGLVFFMSMFLTREQATQFINKISGFKNTSSKWFLANREVVMAYCVKLPHEKIVSSDKNQSLMLDIFNYLNLCPASLYPNLSEGDKRRFKSHLTDDKLNNLINNSRLDSEVDLEIFDEKIDEITTRKRSESRFDYFALRFLENRDSFNAFFQLNIGRIVTNIKKNKIGDKDYDRNISKELKVFGNLLDYSPEDDDGLINIQKTLLSTFKNSEALFFEKYAPHYNLNGNKVIFSFNNSHSDLADGTFSLNELPKVVLLEILSPGKPIAIIKEFIKKNNEKYLNEDFINEIKTLFQKEYKPNPHFNRKKFDKSEILKKKYAILNKILKDKLQYSMDHTMFPDRIVRYWVENEKDINSNLSYLIKNERKNGRELLKSYYKRNLKIGEMANLLAHDIIRFLINIETKQKFTGFYFDKLQESLAFFNLKEYKDVFLGICKKFKLLDDSQEHPFLFQLDVENIQKLSDFFELYYLKREESGLIKFDYEVKKYLKEIKSQKNSNWKNIKIEFPEDSLVPYAFKKRIKEKSNLKLDLDNWLKLAKCQTDGNTKILDLPIGIFDEALKSAIQTKLRKRLDSKTGNYPFSFWIKEIVPANQEFYNWNREYEIFSVKVKIDNSKNQNIKDQYIPFLSQIKESIKKEKIKISNTESYIKNIIESSEKSIRQEIYEDRILLLILKSMFEGKIDDAINLTSFDYYINDESNFALGQSVELNNLIEVKGDKKYKCKIAFKAKIKNYNKAQKIKYDRRLPGFVSFYEDSIIQEAELEKLIKDYHKVMPLVFDKVFEIEKNIVESISESDKIKYGFFNGKYPNVQFDKYLDYLKENGLGNENDLHLLKTVRNKFSHSQFPEKSMHVAFSSITPNNSVIEVFDVFNNLANKIIFKITHG